MARGRKPIVVNARELQEVITKCEQQMPNGVFRTRQELWLAVCETEWAKGQSRPLQPATAMLKAKELGVSIATPIGKRGREKGSARPMGAGGKKRAGMSDKAFKALVSEMPKEVRNAEYIKKILAKVKERRTTSLLVKLKCLECTNWQRSEVSSCEIEGCALWSIRPYKESNKRVPLEVL